MKGKMLFLAATLFLANICLSEPASRESVEEMFALTDMDKIMDGVYGQMDTMFTQIIAEMNITEDERPIMADYANKHSALVRTELSWNKLKEPMIDAYAQVFTEEEVGELIKFYKTPIGKKMLAKMPELMQTSMRTVQESMKNFLPKMQALQKELVNELSNKASVAD